MGAKKRIWLVVPKIEHLLYEDILAEKAVGGTEVRVVAINDGRPTNDIEDFVRDRNQAVESAKKRMDRIRTKLIIFEIGSNITLAISLIFAALISYMWYVVNHPNVVKPMPIFGTPSVESIIHALVLAGVFCLASIVLDIAAERSKLRLGEARTEFMKLQHAIMKEKDVLIRHLIASKSPSVDGLYIVDDKAWINRDGELKEIDVREAEAKFMRSWGA